MKCPECLGTVFEEGLFEMPHTRRGGFVLLRNVPGWRCRQCGFLMLGPEAGRKIERAFKRDTPDATITIDVFDLAKLPDEAPVNDEETLAPPPAKSNSRAS